MADTPTIYAKLGLLLVLVSGDLRCRSQFSSSSPEIFAGRYVKLRKPHGCCVFVAILSSVLQLSYYRDREDLLSALPDDVLVSILGRVDLRTGARTSVLSTRWRRLPWSIPELDIDVKDFMSDQHSKQDEASVIHDAMLAMTAVTKSLLAKLRRESSVARLRLTLYLIDTLLCDIGPLVCDAIDCGLLKHLELDFVREQGCWEYSLSDMIRRSQDMDGFFRAYPTILGCLTKLSLCGLSFVGLDMHHILFDCCKQLTHLTLFFCDAGPGVVWKIDAPNSKLQVMDLDRCSFERIELISLPKLERVNWLLCASGYAPLSFGFVPSLKELCLTHFLYPDEHLLKLSELLHGAAGIHTLTLDFAGQTIWLQLEIKQLASAFSKLKKLSISCVFVEFDLLWITAFLRAAPYVEILHIEVYEPCEMEHVYSPWLANKRTNPRWKPHFRGSKNLQLRELHIDCYRPLKQQLTFIRAILERAPNLQTVFLSDNGWKCGKCDAMAFDESPGASTRPAFPKNEVEQDMVVRRVTDGKSFSGLNIQV